VAKRRKVGNLLGLAVLSTVVERPMHPYEIASTLRERGKEDDMDIKIGSLYTVVRNLEKAGFVEVEDTTRIGARPERTVYRITGAGVAELLDWVRELVAEPQPEHPKFKAGLSVAAVLGPDEVAALLRRRLTTLEETGAQRRRRLGEYAGQVPRVFLLEDEFELAVRDAEAAWVRSLLGELESGTFPDLEMWRSMLAQLSAVHGTPHENENAHKNEIEHDEERS
jgi:DNA-binding PadR family transcriptional regulator